MLEVIRCLKLCPDVEIIATSYRKENEAAAKLYQSLGFKQWEFSAPLEVKSPQLCIEF
ncbi:MAG TPA: hypothetical protein V6D25_02685 [Leptolyngbyaceae cyanobacterium]